MLKPSVEVREQDGLLVAEFWDCLRLDPEPVRDLGRAIDEHRRKGGRPDVVVDLSGVGFAGSAALGGFLALRRRGAHLVFCHVDPTVREVFRVSKLEPLFAFAADRAEALALARSAGEASGPAGPSNGNTPDPSPGPATRPDSPLRRGRGKSP